uniref:Acetylcholine receptor-like protein cup-4 n=1 Tax=Caenorhabditis tropicalis TaxID=1561998 RepID=A0A1I7TM55_9PELO
MWLFLLAALILGHIHGEPETERELHNRLLRTYNKKIRPVKVETTVTQVMVFLNIAHIEKVDEEEQTALIHGHLWASWTDEYLSWDKTKNNISKITISSSRIWQPALALYNSARGNSWHLYMNGMPATLYANGKVWSSGSFSFFVTCQFDFDNWPYDKHSCPIVIADWVYGLAQVNLSDPMNLQEYSKPSIRMSYDPINTASKKHVGGISPVKLTFQTLILGWEVISTWKKHCYWGPQGCKDNQPEGEADWYWSLIEFGVIFQRHLPYYYLTTLTPMVLTAVFFLVIFWVDNCLAAITFIIVNLIIQATYGWRLLQQMPPGSGGAPRIVNIYALTGFLSAFQMALAVFIGYMEEKLPKKYEFKLGFDVTAIPKKLGVEKYFKKVDISFDPQQILSPVVPEAISAPDDDDVSPLDAVDPVNNDKELLISLPSNSDPEENLEEIPHVGMADAAPTVTPEPKESKAINQLHHIKRFLFFGFLFLYIFLFISLIFY